MPDKFAATWVSHSSMSDFLKCPRAYFLNNVYKDPKTNHKLQIVAPPLALGQAVHEVLESLSVLPTGDRFKTPLIDRYEIAWKKVTGKRGGFSSESQEQTAKQRGAEMLRTVTENPGPLLNLSVKIKSELPQYWLSEEDEIILCGKVDWLEFLPDQDAVHVIDFKTSRKVEDGTSLQLPIYHLLVHNTQHRRVAKASYWYLALSDKLVEKQLPDLEAAHQMVIEVAKKIKLQRKLGIFKCPEGEGGCFACKPLEKVIRGEAEYVGVSSLRQDMYMLQDEATSLEDQSEIL
jgi:CRISPR/Cas system-associated exonuclease Cas4 (RecB family)